MAKPVVNVKPISQWRLTFSEKYDNFPTQINMLTRVATCLIPFLSSNSKISISHTPLHELVTWMKQGTVPFTISLLLLSQERYSLIMNRQWSAKVTSWKLLSHFWNSEHCNTRHFSTWGIILNKYMYKSNRLWKTEFSIMVLPRPCPHTLVHMTLAPKTKGTLLLRTHLDKIQRIKQWLLTHKNNSPSEIHSWPITSERRQNPGDSPILLIKCSILSPRIRTFLWHPFSHLAFSNKCYSLLWFSSIQDRLRQEAPPNTLISGGFTNTSNLNCSFFLDTPQVFQTSSPAQYTIKILVMHDGVPFFLKQKGDVNRMGGKRSSLLFCYPDQRLRQERKQTEGENWETDSCRTTWTLKLEEHWVSMSIKQIARKETTMSSLLWNRRIRPTNIVATGIIRQQI